ncbi:MAG: hypothetical protein V3W19_10600 [Desulfatiglandales bacterium]
MNKPEWRIYVGEIPHSEKGDFWVSFESDPRLQKTKANIYGKCLPCIRNLYYQLREGHTEIALGPAFNCWKITAIVKGTEECLSLLSEFEKRFHGGHVYGKFGSGRPNSETRVVVFHTEDKAQRDRIRNTLEQCLPKVDRDGEIQISKACAVLYGGILGDWRHWQATTPVKNPEKVGELLERIKKTLFWSVMQ